VHLIVLLAHLEKRLAVIRALVLRGSEAALNVYLCVLSAAFFLVIWSIRLSSSGAAAGASGGIVRHAMHELAMHRY